MASPSSPAASLPSAPRSNPLVAPSPHLPSPHPTTTAATLPSPSPATPSPAASSVALYLSCACEWCGSVRDASRILRCGGCRLFQYCSAACQKTDWRVRHRLVCQAHKTAAANKKFAQLPPHVRLELLTARLVLSSYRSVVCLTPLRLCRLVLSRLPVCLTHVRLGSLTRLLFTLATVSKVRFDSTYPPLSFSSCPPSPVAGSTRSLFFLSLLSLSLVPHLVPEPLDGLSSSRSNHASNLTLCWVLCCSSRRARYHLAHVRPALMWTLAGRPIVCCSMCAWWLSTYSGGIDIDPRW